MKKIALLIILAIFLIPCALSLNLMPIDVEKSAIDDRAPVKNTIITDTSATLSLHNGWNLISIPIKPDNTAIENVLSSIAGKYVSVWAFDNVNQAWVSYNPYVPGHLNDLHNLDETTGFWIDMNESSDLTVAGTRPTKTGFYMQEGWNYIGYPYNESMNVGSAFNLTNNYYVVWKCNDQSNCVSYSPEIDPPDKFLVEPGYGYSVNITKTKTWVFENKYSPIVKEVSKIGNSKIIKLFTDSYRDAECKYDFFDEDYESMDYSLNGNSVSHEKILTLETGNHDIYVRCNESDILDISSDKYSFELLEPNLYGTIYDTNQTDVAVEDVSISFIPIEEYTANFQTVPEDYTPYTEDLIFDAFSNESGDYAYHLDDGAYSIFTYKIGYDEEREYNILINENYTDINRDFELFPLPNPPKCHDFNVEGHILYKERYSNTSSNGNKYVCGETIKFVMFGIGNDITSPKNVTFWIEDHINGGSGNGIVRYKGNLSKPSEVLTVLTGGAAHKTTKSFTFKIPCDWPKTNKTNGKSKYDIHVYDPYYYGKWHEIGTWFLLNGTASLNVTMVEDAIPTHPAFGTTNITGFTNESLPIYFVPYEGSFDSLYPFRMLVRSSCGSENNETVPCLEADYFRIFGGTEIPVVYETPYNITVNLGNGKSLNIPEGSTNFTVLYNLSGYYNVTALAIGYPSTNSTSKAVIWITEEEADAIAEPIYENLGFMLNNNQNYIITNTDPDFPMFVDRIDNFLTKIGDEYITPNNPNEIERTGYPSDWKEQLNAVIDNCSGGDIKEYIKPIEPCTASEYNTLLTNYLNHLKNDCHAFTKKIKEKPKIKDHKNIDSVSQESLEQQETTVKKIEQVSQPEQSREEIQLIRQPNLDGIKIIKTERKSIFNLIGKFFENIFSIV